MNTLPSAEPHHRVAVDGHLGALALSAAFELRAPWTVLFGASGSGKSTVLRAMCGLISRAAVAFVARDPQGVWHELEGSQRSTPTHRRRLSYAPQGAALFPHLTVQQNVAFSTDKRLQPLVAEALTLFRLRDLAAQYPQQLSGGERQRVNLARAFAVPEPTLLLLDEPFTGIDRALRDDLLPQLQSRLAARGVPVLSVTHDPDEALQLEAEVLRIAAGRITAQGPAAAVLAPERERLLRVLLAANEPASP